MNPLSALTTGLRYRAPLILSDVGARSSRAVDAWVACRRACRRGRRRRWSGRPAAVRRGPGRSAGPDRCRTDRAAAARRGTSSRTPSESLELTPRKAICPPRFSARDWNQGNSKRQGPHHEAHLLTTTGVPRRAAESLVEGVGAAVEQLVRLGADRRELGRRVREAAAFACSAGERESGLPAARARRSRRARATARTRQRGHARTRRRLEWVGIHIQGIRVLGQECFNSYRSIKFLDPGRARSGQPYLGCLP